MSLRPPSSPSPSPGPENGSAKQSRQSLGPGRTPTLAPGSPRLAGGGTRPTSELLGSANLGMYQTPEAEALDAWFENLQSYEATLEDMAAASLDVNFKEELSAIEQWFKVLSEAERTAALYSLLQHSTQVQIRFFITVLQQMARSDPMTALLSPAVGGSMQAQMEAKLASLKSPGLKGPGSSPSGLPASPTARNFTQAATNRQSMLDPPPSAGFLSPSDAANQDASHLAQQRAKLKAANAAHRISAPIMSSPVDRTWGTGGLTQVNEANTGSAASSEDGEKGRPKSIGAAPVPVQEATVPASHESWASMVTTPLPMFPKSEPKENKQAEWKTPGAPGVPRMGDPTIHRRDARNTNAPSGNMYDDNGNFVPSASSPPGRPMGRWNNNNSAANSPASGRFGGNSDDGRGGGMGGNNFGGMNAMNGMGGMPNMNMLAMGISPETQLLAAQMAQAQMAAAGMNMNGMNGMPGMMGGMGWMGGMQPGMMGGMAGMGMNNRMGMGMGMRQPNSASMRTPRSTTSSRSGMDSGTPKTGDEDVDPALLNDIPAWLRSLRLHKYTPNFEGARWQDMVVMSEEQLEAKGVAALGARRKMLKTFEIVRKKMGIEGGPPPTA